jgi:antibiotic biosynthesis monooxygenase (ABM) superfamily enzyme
MNRRPGTAEDPAPVTEPVALVLSRQARPGQEQAFEEVLHCLAGVVRRQPGHLDVTVLRPAPGSLEGWLAAPGAPVLVPPARCKTALVSAAGILPLLEAVSYLLSPGLATLPVWTRSLISMIMVIPLMQYAVMPLLTRATRGFLYPGRAPRPTGGAA